MVFVLPAVPFVELPLHFPALSHLTQHIGVIWIAHLPAYPWNSADSGALRFAVLISQCQRPSVRAGAVLNELGKVGDISQGSFLSLKTLELHLQLSFGSQAALSLSLGAKIQIFRIWIQIRAEELLLSRCS